MKKSNLLMIFLAVALVCAAIAAAVVKRNSDGSADAPAKAQTVEAGGDLVISKSEVDGSAMFYPIDVDGTEMEVLAVRASDGSIRTAFNTCQSCFNSGAGYYVQEGEDLVCQNCGFHFTPDQVEIQSGGCNPWPIFPQNKTETDAEIRISYDFLKESAAIFSHWKQ